MARAPCCASAASALPLCWASAQLCLHGRPSTLAGGLVQSSCGVTAPFLCIFFQERICLCLQDWSLCFPQSCGSVVINSHWTSRPDSLGSMISLSDPGAGKPGVGFRTFETVGELLWWWSAGFGSPAWRERIWFYHDCALLPSLCISLLVFGCGCLFLVVSSILLSVVAQHLVVIFFVLSQEGLSWTGNWFFHS